ncbi:MAG: type II toxin-antitoxin system PemK/MazF family toxin [Candidatus Diapherotrites archaeon]|nr:type II toxin-antitoxin system PemK/MazF family toxin [Candidatus Diapherotrites archaeon]
MIIKRGDVLLADLDPVKGSEQGKIRPCIVVQNAPANQFSPNTIIVPMTSTIPDKKYPTNVILPKGETGLPKESTALCSQVRTISKQHRVLRKMGSLKPQRMREVDEALKTSLALE